MNRSIKTENPQNQLTEVKDANQQKKEAVEETYILDGVFSAIKDSINLESNKASYEFIKAGFIKKISVILKNNDSVVKENKYIEELTSRVKEYIEKQIQQDIKKLEKKGGKVWPEEEEKIREKYFELYKDLMQSISVFVVEMKPEAGATFETLTIEDRIAVIPTRFQEIEHALLIFDQDQTEEVIKGLCKALGAKIVDGRIEMQKGEGLINKLGKELLEIMKELGTGDEKQKEYLNNQFNNLKILYQKKREELEKLFASKQQK